MAKLLLTMVFSLTLLNSNLVTGETLRFVYSEGDPPLSFAVNGQPAGLFPELVELVFRYIPELNVLTESYPWSRAQLLIEKGARDGFITYPSDKRKGYALFSDQAVFVQDYGYLAYRKDNANRVILKAAKSFQDLSDLTVIVEHGSDWEVDNIPSFLRHVKAPNQDTMIHLLFLRKDGDFVVMPPENAKHLAEKFGYQNDLAYNSVKFIDDSLIPFHIGLSKKTNNAAKILGSINAVLLSPEFKNEKQKIIDQYR